MKFPFTKQDGSNDCGAACLSMIIKHYKGYINLEELREKTKTNRSGTNAYNIVKYALELGFNSYGIKTNLEDKNIVLPAIAHTTIDNKYNHFIVITKINKKKRFLIIADPADRIKKISFEEFDKIWTGNLIILYPLRKIPLKKDISLYDFVIGYLKAYKNNIMIIFLISFLLMFLILISSLYFKIITNVFSKNLIIILLLSFIIINVLKNITSFFRTKLLISLNHKLELNLMSDAYSKIISLPHPYFKDNTTGDIVSRLDKLESINELINKLAITLFMDLPIVIVSFFILLKISNKLFFISFIEIILYLLINIIFKKSLTNNIENIQSSKALTYSYIVESIKNFETIKGLNVDPNPKFNMTYINYLNTSYKFNNLFNFQTFLKDNIYDISNLIIIFYGFILVLNNEINIGTLLTYNSIMNYFTTPIKNTLDLNYLIKDSKEAIKRICNLFHDNNDSGFIDKKLNGNIRFNNLSFGYDKKILNNINLKINKKEKIMIIGASGTGKSTLLKLIMKYNKAKRDSLYIDNIDINDIKDNAIHKNISYISQQENLFNDTILNNITLKSRKNIDKVIDICEINEITKKTPLGYNTLINEDSFNLSGGEKQRIILARTLLSEFNILLIDEGLNEIDINLERKILTKLFKEYNDKTIIIISHRLENMDLFDKVINLERNDTY